MSKLIRFATAQGFKLLILILMLQGLVLAAFPLEASAQNLPSPPSPVKKVVDRNDLPVASGAAHRSWTWGTYFAVQNEPYQEAPGGNRAVFYYDKGRLEVNNPQSDQSNPYYTTSGLLLRELITGQVQLGDNSFSQREPAEVVLAGDNPPLVDTAPTYADLHELVSFDGTGKSADLTGGKTSLLLKHGGGVDNSFAGLNRVKYAQYDAATGHNIADVFLNFTNSNGLVSDGGKLITAPLYNPLYVFGHPISEPYWTQVTVAGNKRAVLVQAFERRLLTYTPDNSPEFQVELGNIGRAYYQWRYGNPGSAPVLDPVTPIPTTTPALDFYNQTVGKLNGVRSVQFSQYTNLQQIQIIRYEAPNKRYYLERYDYCGTNGYYAEITIESRVYFNCLVNNSPTLTWTYVDLAAPFRWPSYSPINLNDLTATYSFGPDATIGSQPVKNIVTTSLDLQGNNVATITGISTATGLPLEGSRTYEADGQRQIFNIKYDNYNQSFNIQAPQGAVPYDSAQPNQLNNFADTKSELLQSYIRTVPSKVEPNQAEAQPGEILVKFRQPPANVPKLLDQTSRLLNWQNGQSGAMAKNGAGILKVAPDNVEATLAALKANPLVEYAEPNYLYSTSAIKEPNDAQYPDQWYLKAVRLPRAWSLSTGQTNSSDPVKVAVIDTGVNVAHPDLQPNIVGNYDLFDGAYPNTDPVGHGTLVAGTITALGNNSQFGTGVAWHTQLYSYRSGDRRGLTCKAVSDSIRDATDKGVRIINLSLGGYKPCQTMGDAIAYAIAKNVVVVAAAGNDSTDADIYPAAFPGVIAVGASGRLGTPASFSNYGKNLALIAPGVDICGTAGTSRFGCASGTSFSSPIVAGVVALMLNVNPDLTPAQVKALLIATAIPAPGRAKGEFDNHYGYGSLDAFAAVRAVAANQLPRN